MISNDNESFERLRFEHELINRRITWLLASQSILFAAYAIALNKEITKFKTENIFLEIIAISGTFVALLIFIGVIAGIVAKYRIWKDSHEKEWGVRTTITRFALIPDILLPILFMIAWLFILLN